MSRSGVFADECTAADVLRTFPGRPRASAKGFSNLRAKGSERAFGRSSCKSGMGKPHERMNGRKGCLPPSCAGHHAPAASTRQRDRAGEKNRDTAHLWRIGRVVRKRSLGSIRTVFFLRSLEPVSVAERPAGFIALSIGSCSGLRNPCNAPRDCMWSWAATHEAQQCGRQAAVPAPIAAQPAARTDPPSSENFDQNGPMGIFIDRLERSSRLASLRL